MSLNKAKEYLAAVMNRTRCIPFHRYCGGVGRTAQAKNENSTTGQGRWPVKSVEFIQGLLRNAESNAEARTRCYNRRLLARAVPLFLLAQLRFLAQRCAPAAGLVLCGTLLRRLGQRTFGGR